VVKSATRERGASPGGLVMRRERQAPWSPAVLPDLGRIILGWILTRAAVELHMFQRLLDTQSLSCPVGSGWSYWPCRFSPRPW
jgi:hypothetical protein